MMNNRNYIGTTLGNIVSGACSLIPDSIKRPVLAAAVTAPLIFGSGAAQAVEYNNINPNQQTQSQAIKYNTISPDPQQAQRLAIRYDKINQQQTQNQQEQTEDILAFGFWNAPEAADIVSVLAFLQNDNYRVIRYDNTSGSWDFFIPGAPAFASTITTFEPGVPYAVKGSLSDIAELLSETPFDDTATQFTGSVEGPMTLYSGLQLLVWGGENNISARQAVEGFSSYLESVFGFNVDTQTFEAYIPGAPAIVSPLKVLETGGAYWLRANKAVQEAVQVQAAFFSGYSLEITSNVGLPSSVFEDEPINFDVSVIGADLEKVVARVMKDGNLIMEETLEKANGSYMDSIALEPGNYTINAVAIGRGKEVSKLLGDIEVKEDMHPEITSYNVPSSVNRSNNCEVNVSVRATDDRGISEVYMDIESLERITLEESNGVWTGKTDLERTGNYDWTITAVDNREQETSVTGNIRCIQPSFGGGGGGGGAPPPTPTPTPTPEEEEEEDPPLPPFPEPEEDPPLPPFPNP